ncbi:MAG TPA: hypothetical protein VFJ16_02240 [Longimicrobium sp.]|nr:hypothetical protein [Longimicrobium sp.]
MDGFGGVAVRAVELVGKGTCGSAPEAWETAAREVFPHSRSQQVKSCPRGAFLGLCEEGLVSGIPPGNYTTSRDNKAYAVRAAALLGKNPALADAGARALWNTVLAGHSKVHNAQMDVVLGLHRRDLLRRD